MRYVHSFVALSLVAVASGYFFPGDTHFSDGNISPTCELLYTHANYLYFNGNEPQYYHFNTCHENSIIIEKFEIVTHRGKGIKGRIVDGGVGTYYAVIEVRGDKEANTETKFWGYWKDKKSSEKIDQVFFLFDRHNPCPRSNLVKRKL